MDSAPGSRHIRRASVPITAPLLLALAVGAGAQQQEPRVAATVQQRAERAAASSIPESQILYIRRATERFRDLNVAMGEGYIHDPMMMCVDAQLVGQPRSRGGMGIHLFHPALLGISLPPPVGRRLTGTDSILDWSRPEVLVYEPQAEGPAQLVAVEYLVFEKAWNAAGHRSPPSLGGTPFFLMRDDPSTPTDEAHMLEPHYELHLWLYRDNPNGMLAEFNPRVTCRYQRTAADVRPSSIREARLPEGNESTLQVSTQELEAMLASRSADVIDVRSRREYDAGHIPGALHVSSVPMVDRAASGTAVATRAPDSESARRPVVLYCEGPYCSEARRVGDALRAAGYLDVRRYQLGVAIWTALGGALEIDRDIALQLMRSPHGLTLVDARNAAEFSAGTITTAQNIPYTSISHQQGDLNLRGSRDALILVFAADGAQARAVAETLKRHSFPNVVFFGGGYRELKGDPR